MPIYLAQPGISTKEPWRHGLQVYDRPFSLDFSPSQPQPMEGKSNEKQQRDQNLAQQQQQQVGDDGRSGGGGAIGALRPEMRHDTSISDEGAPDYHLLPTTATAETSSSTSPETIAKQPKPVRRIRHAEVVLVDQCLIAYGRYWLRIKWPGSEGGHGGYVALSRTEDVDVGAPNDGNIMATADDSGVNNNDEIEGQGEGDVSKRNIATLRLMGVATSAVSPTSLLCSQTNVHYPTSAAMKLLPSYDDGLSDKNDNNKSNYDDKDEILISLDTGEPVFCRICREGLHDVNTDYLDTTTPPQQQSSSSSRVINALDDDADEGSPGPIIATSREGRMRTPSDAGETISTTTNNNATTMRNDSEEGRNATGERSSSAVIARLSEEGATGGDAITTTNTNKEKCITIPHIMRYHPSAENPLLAPCVCTGSMAFVHYLCVEQWRCRSRHPGARNGLNCETCGAEYTLPPPPSRPHRNPNAVDGGNNMMVDDDWLDAMPPHVLAALRRPHPWWQLGAAVVRRRWLRPIVPVLASPLVALYCKARRTLKKRGVSRRRWACSLCRRRARWKCVRCLRSYYCSRQCQNVSWHIVHKHVCYKPVRLWWSVVVYTLGTLILVPGIIKNIPIYDTSASLLPVNFVAMGNIAGGVASFLKRMSGIDIRGRILEISVIICTLFITAVSSGVVRAYFGDSSQCWGVLASATSSWAASAAVKGPFIDSASNKAFAALLHYAQLYYKKWDFLCARAGFLSRQFLCTPTVDGNTDYASIGCSPPVRNINTYFYLEDENCRADVAMVGGLWVAAILVLFLEHVYREYRVRRRVAVHRGRRRPHQD